MQISGLFGLQSALHLGLKNLVQTKACLSSHACFLFCAAQIVLDLMQFVLRMHSTLQKLKTFARMTKGFLALFEEFLQWLGFFDRQGRIFGGLRRSKDTGSEAFIGTA